MANNSTEFHFTISDKNIFSSAGKIKIEQCFSPRKVADLQSSKCSLIQLNLSHHYIAPIMVKLGDVLMVRMG